MYRGITLGKANRGTKQLAGLVNTARIAREVSVAVQERCEGFVTAISWKTSWKTAAS